MVASGRSNCVGALHSASVRDSYHGGRRDCSGQSQRQCALRSDRPKHPGSTFAVKCKSVCLSPSNRERLLLPNGFGVVGPKQVALAPNLTSQQGQRNTPRENSRTSVLVAQAPPASSSVRSSSLRRESIHARRNPFRRCIRARGGSLWAGTIVSAGPTSRRVLRARYNRNHPERLLRPAQCRGALIPVVLPRMRGILTSTEIAPCPRRPSKLARPVMESTFGWERCLPQREKADRHDDARILPGNSIVGVIGRPALQYVLNTGDSPPAIWRAIVWAWK